MRYKDKGELHRDFHLATNRTIDYVMAKYGESFLKELCRRTAQSVYKNIYTCLIEGDMNPLIEHLFYYMDREEGDCKIVRGDSITKLFVRKCPMISYISSKGHMCSSHMGLFLTFLYESWGENTPFHVLVELDDPATDYTIVIRRKDASQ